MQIVIWSDPKYASGQTTLSILLSTMIACRKGYKTFLTSSLIADESLEYYSLKSFERELEQFVGESNIEGLIRRIKNGKLTKDMIKDYCFSLLAHSNLDMLQSGKTLVDNEEYHTQFGYLISLVNMYYNISVIDCDLELDHSLTKTLLKTTDVMVVVGEPNRYRLEKLSNIFENQEGRIKEIPKVFIVNKWEKGIVKPIHKKLMGIEPMYIPYYPTLIEQANQNNLVDYILRLNYSKKNYEAHAFLKSIEKAVERILLLGEEKIANGTTAEFHF